jgi:dihydrodipicolinate synthase/N-acetylneuraminate lyase
MFSLDDGALLKHFDRILQAIDIPLIIQDFNPGGVPSVLALLRNSTVLILISAS